MITYHSDIAAVSPPQLRGFFVRWKKPLTPDEHYTLLTGSTHFVAAIDSETNMVVGFVTALTDGYCSSFIPLLEVLPEYQSKGIGSALMERILAKLKDIPNVDLTCYPELQPFYERFGMLKSNGMVLRKHIHPVLERTPTMKLLTIIGNAAVGKMTVGQELTKITGLRLLHNHIVIEPVLEVFGTFDKRIMERLRSVILEEFAASGQYGLIMTGMLNFDSQKTWDYLADIRAVFEPYNTGFYYAELVVPSQEIRLRRNVSENRLLHKPSKRDIEASNQRLLNDDAKARCVSREGEITFENYIRIDNSELPPDAAAKMIKERFGL